MKTRGYTLGAMLGVIALIAPAVVRADSVTVTADLTFDTCAAATGCQETIDVTYGWNNTTNTLASSSVIASIGDLGNRFTSTPFVGGADPILALLSPANAVILKPATP